MTRVPPHVPAPSAGYHVLPVRTIALIGLKPVRRHNLRLRCRRWVISGYARSGLRGPLHPQQPIFAVGDVVARIAQRRQRPSISMGS